MFKIFILFFSFTLFANEDFINDSICGSDDLMNIKSIKYPWYKESADKVFNKALDYSKKNNFDRNTIYQIPVVFHIVYNTDEQNLADEVIQSQLDVLNEDFRRLNENASETREQFLPFAGDPQIEFYFATEDPVGNPTTGITRTYTSNSGFPYISIIYYYY